MDFESQNRDSRLLSPIGSKSPGDDAGSDQERRRVEYVPHCRVRSCRLLECLR